MVLISFLNGPLPPYHLEMLNSTMYKHMFKYLWLILLFEPDWHLFCGIGKHQSFDQESIPQLKLFILISPSVLTKMITMIIPFHPSNKISRFRHLNASNTTRRYVPKYLFVFVMKVCVAYRPFYNDC